VNRLAEEEEEDGFALDPEQLNIFYEVLFNYAIKYGMMVEKSYDEIGASSVEDEQGFGPEKEKAIKRSVIKKDVDKLRMFL